MRRSEKEITDRETLVSLMQRAQVCRLGLTDGTQPYVVPVCFGYRDGALYIHSAWDGKKIELIRKNNNVCFEFDMDVEVLQHELPCEWGMGFRSVVGYGKATFLEELDEIESALHVIMNQYGEGEFQFSRFSLEAVAVIRIDIESMTGKQSGF